MDNDIIFGLGMIIMGMHCIFIGAVLLNAHIWRKKNNHLSLREQMKENRKRAREMSFDDNSTNTSVKKKNKKSKK